MKSMQFFSGLIFVTLMCACTSKQLAVGAAQIAADTQCSNNNNVSYLRCGTNVESEYQKNKQLKEQSMKEADEAVKQKQLEDFKKAK